MKQIAKTPLSHSIEFKYSLTDYESSPQDYRNSIMFWARWDPPERKTVCFDFRAKSDLEDERMASFQLIRALLKQVVA